jgi:hypothetical protein
LSKPSLQSSQMALPLQERIRIMGRRRDAGVMLTCQSSTLPRYQTLHNSISLPIHQQSAQGEASGDEDESDGHTVHKLKNLQGM